MKSVREMAAEMIGEVMSRKTDRASLAMLDYMKGALEEAKILKFKPDWAKIFEESRRIWQDK